MQNETDWTPLEQLIASVWKEVLNLDEVARDHDFIDLGGKSLQAVKVAAKCQKLLNKRVTIAHVMKGRTIAGMASALH